MPYMDRGTYNQVVELPLWVNEPVSAPHGESVLPPGQSGFVDSENNPSPFAYDQLPLYVSWAFKDMHIDAEDYPGK